MQKGELKVIIIGPPGSGKSHLSTAMARWLQFRLEVPEVEVRLHDNFEAVKRKSNNDLNRIIKQVVTKVAIEEMHVRSDFDATAGWDDEEDARTTRHYQEKEITE